MIFLSFFLLTQHLRTLFMSFDCDPEISNFFVCERVYTTFQFIMTRLHIINHDIEKVKLLLNSFINSAEASKQWHLTLVS